MSRARQLLVPALLIALVTCAWLAPLDATATRQVETGLKRALVSFASARALNAVISVVQGTEVDIHPVGFGVTLSPGQALDPVNDLVEQFSTLMLFASVSFGVQLLLLKFGTYWAVSAALTAAAVAWIAWRWQRPPAQPWLARLVIALVIVRFAVPVVVAGSEGGFQLLLAERYAADQQKIDLSANRLSDMASVTPAPGTKPEGLADRFKRWLTEGPDIAKTVSRRIDELKAFASETVEHMVMLMAVFVVQTIVLPLVILWGLLRIGRGLAAAGS